MHMDLDNSAVKAWGRSREEGLMGVYVCPNYCKYFLCPPPLEVVLIHPLLGF